MGAPSTTSAYAGGVLCVNPGGSCQASGYCTCAADRFASGPVTLEGISELETWATGVSVNLERTYLLIHQYRLSCVLLEMVRAYKYK